MGKSLTRKILEKHLVVGEYVSGKEIGIRIDQTLTQDATGTMAYLQFEAMGLKQVKTELSVSYVDHNTIQVGFENADDHKYLQTVAAKYGIIYWKAGNGRGHQGHPVQGRGVIRLRIAALAGVSPGRPPARFR